jgi:hypothetical protein
MFRKRDRPPGEQSVPGAFGGSPRFPSQDALWASAEEARRRETVRLEISDRKQIIVGNYGTHAWALLVRNGPDGKPYDKPLVFIECCSQNGFLALLDINDPAMRNFPMEPREPCNGSYDRNEATRVITAIYLDSDGIGKYGIPISPNQQFTTAALEAVGTVTTGKLCP